MILIPGMLTTLASSGLKLLSGMHMAQAMFLTTVFVRERKTGMLSRIGSSGEEAMGQVDRWPCIGSRIRPEMNDEAAEEGWG